MMARGSPGKSRFITILILFDPFGSLQAQVACAF
jgi:hypothetical protein